MPERQATIYVIDDDEAMRDSLAWLLESHGHRVRTFGSSERFLDAYNDDFAGCLLLDIRMPGMSGLELQERLAAAAVSLPVIFITAHGDVPMAVQALKRGAADFLEKPFNDFDLLRLVNDCLERDVRHRKTARERARAISQLAQLTPREREVMDLVVAGKSNKLIARELDISIKTVEAHRARVMGKMGADSVAALVRLVSEARSGMPSATDS